MWMRLYGRKSRYLGDPEDLDLMAHQVLPLKRVAEGRGLALREEHIILEVGSSETIDERPNFAALLREIEAMPPNTGGLLFVWEISRLSRGSRPDRARIADALERAGILVVTPTQTYDLADPDSDFMFSVLSQQSRREQLVYKRRIRDTRDASLELGKIRNGRAPWGYVYDRERKTLDAHPENFPRLVACCREVLTDSIRTLAQRHGVSQRVLQNSLTNPKICGWPAIISGPSKNGKHTSRLPRHRWREAGRVNDTYPHACSREQFDRIQQVLIGRAKHKTKTKGDHGWCRDLVTFAEAPGRVVLGATGSHPGKPPREIYERREKRDGKWYRLAYIERATVHDAAYNALRAILTSPERLAHLRAAYLARLAQVAQESDCSGTERQLIAAIEALRVKFKQSVAAEFDASPRLRDALTERRIGIEAELDRLEEQLAALRKPLQPDPSLLMLLENLPTIVRAFEQNWPEWPESTKRAVANALLARIVCRVERQPAGQAWRRWIETVELQPWASE